jgi:GH25 family lysozyme M1 (1,4-beta-N-acetylmuramidase)
MVTMPVARGFYVTSPYGQRTGQYAGMHWGTDFGNGGGSGGHPIYAVKDGTVTRAGAASGFGQWITVDHPASNGGGLTVYGHIIPEVAVGATVREGQRIGRIDPDSGTNGGVSPHLHLEWHRYVWAQPGADRLDPMTKLAGAAWPGETTTTGGTVNTIFGIDVSEHQDGMSLHQAAREGFDFAFIRTTDGTHKDRCYTSHLDDAEGAGMVVGAYHFCRRPNEGTTVAQQVDASVAVMGGKKRPLWLDVETPGGFSGDLVAQFKAEFERCGVHVAGVYSYVPYWEGQMAGGEPDTHQFGKLWVAGYPSTRTGAASAIYESIGGDGARQWSHPLGNQAPSIWQFTDRATVAGHQVDANAFRGSADALRTLINGGEAANSEEEITVAEADRIIKHIEDFIAGFCGPIGSDTKDIREQLTGGRDAGQYPGWNVGSILNAARRKNVRALTSMEIQAVLLAGTKDDIKAARAAAQEQ